LRRLHWRRHTLVVLHRTDTCKQIKNLAKRNVQASDSAPYRRCQRPLDSDPKRLDGGERVIRQPLTKLFVCFLTCENFIPMDVSFSAISFLNRGIEDAC